MASRRLAPRPKRGGEEFTRTHYQNDDDAPSASKKLRFDVRNPSALAPDAAEEDAILDADEIGKRGQQVKRNAVNIDGYDSDSSNEGFDARAEAKARELAAEGKGGTKANGAGAQSVMEEENDMFADVEEAMEGGGDGDEVEEIEREGKSKRKQVKFLDEKDIEGEVLSSKGGGHVNADLTAASQGQINGKGKGIAHESDADDDESTDSDVDDEARAEVGQADEEVGAGGKKEHAPRLDAFNMRNEQEEGRFDDQGNFVRKAADTDAMYDSWLEGVSKKDMRRAKEASDKRNDELRLKRMENDRILTSDILARLIPLLDRGETVLEALARLGRGKKEKPKWQKGRRKDSNDMDVDREKRTKSSKERRRREAIEAITETADQLLTRGQTEIYETERELLTRQYTRETGEQWTDPPPVDDEEDEEEEHNGEGEARQWEYRWSDARDRGQIHGPYDGKMMKAWVDAGYFGDGIEYRKTGQDVWTRNAEFV